MTADVPNKKLLRDLEMKKGLLRKMDDPGFTHLYTFTVQLKTQE